MEVVEGGACWLEVVVCYSGSPGGLEECCFTGPVIEWALLIVFWLYVQMGAGLEAA